MFFALSHLYWIWVFVFCSAAKSEQKETRARARMNITLGCNKQPYRVGCHWNAINWSISFNINLLSFASHGRIDDRVCVCLLLCGIIGHLNSALLVVAQTQLMRWSLMCTCNRNKIFNLHIVHWWGQSWGSLSFSPSSPLSLARSLSLCLWGVRCSNWVLIDCACMPLEWLHRIDTKKNRVFYQNIGFLCFIH